MAGDGRSANGRPKLRADDIETIRYLRDVPAVTLAILFGVHRSRIYQIQPRPRKDPDHATG